MSDYIKLPRSALTDELWNNDGAALRVYMYLVKQSECGVAHTSTAQIMRATRLTERRVRDALSLLETSNRTSSKRSSKRSDITLCGVDNNATLTSSKRSDKTSSKRSDKTSSKRSDKNALSKQIPEYVSPLFVAPEFAETWRKFITYRKEIRKPYKSESSERIAYNKMVEMADNNPEIARDMVERTILGQWQGLFPKDNHGTKPITPTDNAATRKASRDRMLGFANRIVSQSAGKLASLYNGSGENPDDSRN